MPSKRDRRSISVILKGIFSRSNSKRDDSQSRGKKKSKNDSNKPIDFGIADTEKLVHFSRPKPPRNRRPPRSGSGTASKIHSRQPSVKSFGTDDNDDLSGARSVASSSCAMPKSRESLRSLGSSSNGAVSKSASNLSEHATDGKKTPPQGEEKKKSSIWNLFHREKSNKSTAEEEVESAPTSAEDERLINDVAPTENVDDEEVEKRPPRELRSTGKRVLRSESFGAEELNLSAAGRRGSPYTSYQEFIRVTHKSMPATEVVLS